MSDILTRIVALQDEEYKAFCCKLIPTVPLDRVLGVRTPALRALAKELAGSEQAATFTAQLPHAYYEENNLHAFLIEGIRDFDACVTAVDAFLPYVDNWATCDGLSPAVFGRHKAALLPHCRRWLQSEHTYTARFGVCMLMKHFLKEDFAPVHLEWVVAADREEYYIHMVVAWYVATALCYQYEAALPVLVDRRLCRWTHNKAIQKAVESYRLTAEQKEYLKTLKV